MKKFNELNMQVTRRKENSLRKCQMIILRKESQKMPVKAKLIKLMKDNSHWIMQIIAMFKIIKIDRKETVL